MELSPTTAPLVHLVRQVNRVSPETMECLESLENKDQLDRISVVTKALVASSVQLGLQVSQELMDLLVPLVPMEIQEHLEEDLTLARQDLPDHPETLETTVRLVSLDLLVNLEHPVHLEEEILDQLVHPVLLEDPDNQDKMEVQEMVGHLDQLDQLDPLEIQEHLALTVSPESLEDLENLVVMLSTVLVPLGTAPLKCSLTLLPQHTNSGFTTYFPFLFTELWKS